MTEIHPSHSTPATERDESGQINADDQVKQDSTVEPARVCPHCHNGES